MRPGPLGGDGTPGKFRDGSRDEHPARRRGYTGRDKIIKFAGCYHGHCDAMLVQAGSGLMTAGIPSSAGITQGCAQDTLTAPYNDLNAVRQIWEQNPGQIAAVILEPVAANMGVVPPKPGFLAGLRELCTLHGTLLIFDEVITGFRLGLGGAQEYYGVKPDLTCFGKVIGAGMPVGAYGGRREVMEQIAPLGPVYQAGTLSGNPIAVAAGLAQLDILERDPSLYLTLEQRAGSCAKGSGRFYRHTAHPAPSREKDRSRACSSIRRPSAITRPPNNRIPPGMPVFPLSAGAWHLSCPLAV